MQKSPAFLNFCAKNKNVLINKLFFKFPKIIVYECRKILLMVLVLTMVYWRAKSAKKAARLADLLCSALWVPKA